MRVGSCRRVLRTQALRRGELPRTAAPVTDRLRSPPYPAAAPQHHDQAVNVAPSAPGAVKRSQRQGRYAAHCPGLAPPASTVLRIPLRGTRLRRAVDPGDLCQPSEPGGKGQAKGQARNARAEPPQ